MFDISITDLEIVIPASSELTAFILEKLGEAAYKTAPTDKRESTIENASVMDFVRIVAILSSYQHSPSAAFVTTIVLAFGFFVFMGASMSNIFNFGLLTGIAIIIAVLADFFLVPAIMKIIK